MTSSEREETLPDAGETELWLVRHGESTANRDGVLQGQAEWPLSPLGERQAAALAQRLVGSGFSAIYSSDLDRALATATAVARRLDLAVSTDPRLREIDTGSWTGFTSEQVATRFPEEWAAWQAKRDPDHQRGGGESYRQVQHRMVEVLTAIGERHPGQRVLVVGHGVAIGAYLVHLLGMPAGSVPRLTLANTAISRVLPFADAHVGTLLPGRILCIGDSAHLEGLAVD